MVRATAHPGRPDLGGGFKREALTAAQTSLLVRTLAHVVCDVPISQVMRFGTSSIRKFLPSLASARGCQEHDIRDLGRWTGSWSSQGQIPGVAQRILKLWVQEQKREGSYVSYVREGWASRVQALESNMPLVGGFELSAWLMFHEGAQAALPIDDVWPRSAAPPAGEHGASGSGRMLVPASPPKGGSSGAEADKGVPPEEGSLGVEVDKGVSQTPPTPLSPSQSALVESIDGDSGSDCDMPETLSDVEAICESASEDEWDAEEIAMAAAS